MLYNDINPYFYHKALDQYRVCPPTWILNSTGCCEALNIPKLTYQYSRKGRVWQNKEIYPIEWTYTLTNYLSKEFEVYPLPNDDYLTVIH